MNNTSNLEVDGLQVWKTTSGSTPASQDQESEAIMKIGKRTAEEVVSGRPTALHQSMNHLINVPSLMMTTEFYCV